MRRRILMTALLFIACTFSLTASAREAKQPTPIGWIYVKSGSLTLLPRMGPIKGKASKVLQGTLVPVFDLKEKGGAKWARVRTLSLAAAALQDGWVDSTETTLLPPEAYPPDAELLKLVGGAYLDDITAAHISIARFLVPQGPGAPLLLCYLYGSGLPTAKLVAFAPSQGKYVLGPALDFPASEMNAGITSLEIRDLVGDSRGCIMTHEPFGAGPETHGVNVVIRRIEDDRFLTVWEAPIDSHSLSAFKPKVEILQPPEKNIGAPGTVTTGEVTFRPRANQQDLVWKGKVEFFVFGREKAVDSVNIEKVCTWDGKEFTPLR